MIQLKNFLRALDKTEYLLGCIVFVLIFAVVSGSRLLRLENTQAIRSETEKVIYLYHPVTLDSLLAKMSEKQITFNEPEMRWAANILGWKRFRKGRYEISGTNSYDVFLSRLAKGIQDPERLTILPGITIDKFVQRATNELVMSAEDLKLAFRDSALLNEFDVAQHNIIGRLLPETYLVYWDTRPKQLLRRILTEFDTNVHEPAKPRLKELDATIDEIVTLASIVEWEATYQNEKKTIAGLYWNRLNRGMRLQADPTVNYAVDERRRLLLKDYKIDHPYNTYKINGLPPGPITNPAKSTIEATLYPEKHDYLYMVSSPGGDNHIFSKTYSEHMEATKKWRSWLQKQYQIKRQRQNNSKSDAS